MDGIIYSYLQQMGVINRIVLVVIDGYTVCTTIHIRNKYLLSAMQEVRYYPNWLRIQQRKKGGLLMNIQI